MNYLQIVRATREIVGMQGSGPASTVGATGVDAVLASMVRTAYIDIQSLRDEFDFLSKKMTFNTIASVDEYTADDIFATSTLDLAKYDKDSFYLTDSSGVKRKLTYLDREVLEQRYLNNSDEQLPTYFTIDHADNTLILKPISDRAYTVNFRYWREPEILSEDSQVPILPVQFHQLIVYKAVEKMAVYMNAQSSYGEYNYEAKVMIGQLMRKSIRKKRLKRGALV